MVLPTLLIVASDDIVIGWQVSQEEQVPGTQGRIITMLDSDVVTIKEGIR